MQLGMIGLVRFNRPEPSRPRHFCAKLTKRTSSHHGDCGVLGRKEIPIVCFV